MRIWCLTSLTKRDFESYMTQNQYDYYTSKLEGCEKYAFTELFVGKSGPNFEFHVHREDIGVLRYMMDSDMLRYTKVAKNVVDVEVAPNNGFALQVFVKKIRIRCIKSDSNRNLTMQQKTYFENFANKIEEYANGDPDRREAAFSAAEIEKFEYDNDEGENSRFSDLLNAFNGLCQDDEKRVSARYNQFIDRNIVINYHSKNDERIKYIKDFTKTKEIKLYRSKLTYINPKWFDAINLEVLYLSHVSPFEFKESWKYFANGIKNCQKLRQLTLHECEINDIPDYVYEALPVSIVTLALANNNLKKLSPLISRLTNLESLSVSFNPNLTDDGMPWDALSEKLVMLDIDGTKIKRIPAKIKRLQSLEFLFCGNHVNYVKWNYLPEGLEQLSIECCGRINQPRSFQRYKKLGNFVLTNAGLNRRFFKHLRNLYRFVDLSGNNFKTLKCPNYSPDVTRLYLNHCRLTSVDWVDVWRVLPCLEQLQLRHNQLTEVFPHPLFFDYCVLTHLDLEDNQIQAVSGEFLPPSIRYLDLSHNQISSFDAIDNLRQLAYLFIESNQLENLPEGVERCWHLKAVVASKNLLTSLPEGFEDLPDLVHLNLSSNKFGSSNVENIQKILASCLWDRLPRKVDVLMLSNNALRELPCQLSTREIWRLEVDNCQLRHICPRIGSLTFPRAAENYISIKLNDELENLSFVPSKIYTPPSIYDEKTNPNENKGHLVLTSDKSFKDTSRWQTTFKVHNYDFNFKHSNKEPYSCHCCAHCGTNVETGFIETFMVMDFTHIVETPPYETTSNKGVIDEYGPGEWKTMVKTKICLECLKKLKSEITEFYDEMPLKRKQNTLKRKQNTRKKKQKTDTAQLDEQQNNPPFALPETPKVYSNNLHEVAKAHQIDSHLRLLEQDITSATATVPDAFEHFVQMDNTVLYLQPQQPLEFVSSHDSYIYSTPGPSYFMPNYNIPNTDNQANINFLLNSQSYYLPDVVMQDPRQNLVFTNNMDDNEFNDKAKLL